MFNYSDQLMRGVSRIGPLKKPVAQRVSSQAGKVLAVGEEMGWDFKVLGRAPMVKAPIFTGNWWIVPAQMDTALIPAEIRPRVMDRVGEIYQAGIQPKGWIMAHEAPKLLAAPQGQALPMPWWQRYWLMVAMRPVAVGALAISLVVVGPMIAAFLVGLLVKVVMAMAVIVAIPAAILGLGAISAVDPLLILVTEDNVWIQIDQWE